MWSSRARRGTHMTWVTKIRSSENDEMSLKIGMCCRTDKFGVSMLVDQYLNCITS